MQAFPVKYVNKWQVNNVRWGFGATSPTGNKSYVPTWRYLYKQQPLPMQAQMMQHEPMQQQQQHQHQQQPYNANYQSGQKTGMNIKTILCKNFSQMGMCKYGGSCNFAHGENDLKRPVDLINQEQAAAINQAQNHAVMMQQINIKITQYQL